MLSLAISLGSSILLGVRTIAGSLPTEVHVNALVSRCVLVYSLLEPLHYPLLASRLHSWN